jgi:hypothetical protein
MINIGAESKNLNVIAYAREVYINTDTKVLRLKICRIWLNPDGTEFKREYRTVVYDNTHIHHYEAGPGTDMEGNPVQIPVYQFDHWMSRQLPSGPAYQVLADMIETNLLAESHIKPAAADLNLKPKT